MTAKECDIADIEKIKETNNCSEANDLIRHGWTMFRVSTGPTGYHKYLLVSMKNPIDSGDERGGYDFKCEGCTIVCSLGVSVERVCTVPLRCPWGDDMQDHSDWKRGPADD